MKSLAARGVDAFHRLVGDFRRRIVQERNEQPAETRIGDLADRDRDVAARALGRVVGVAGQIEQRRFGLVDVRGAGAAGQRHRRRGADARIGIGEERPGERGRIFLADRRERADRRGAHTRVAVAEHAADVRHPLLGDVAAHGAERRQRAAADLRRLVIEEERRHQVPLVDRLEHVNRVDDACRVGVRQFLDQRFDRRELRSAQAQLVSPCTSPVAMLCRNAAGSPAWRANAMKYHTSASPAGWRN